MPLPADLPPPPAISVPEVRATGLPGENDAVWDGAARIAALPLAPGPEAVGKTALPTTVRLLWSAERLLIRFDCSGGDAWAPFGDTADAPHYQGDVVEVFLDPVGDARQFLEWEISPKNGVFSKLYLATAAPVSQADGVLSADFLRRDEWEFPAYRLEGMQTAAAPRPDGGWTAILTVPARPLLRRLGKSQFVTGMVLHANFIRYDYAPPARKVMTAMNWSPVPWGRPHRAPARMGTLTLAPAQKTVAPGSVAAGRLEPVPVITLPLASR